MNFFSKLGAKIDSTLEDASNFIDASIASVKSTDAYQTILAKIDTIADTANTITSSITTTTEDVVSQIRNVLDRDDQEQVIITAVAYGMAVKDQGGEHE